MVKRVVVTTKNNYAPTNQKKIEYNICSPFLYSLKIFLCSLEIFLYSLKIFLCSLKIHIYRKIQIGNFKIKTN